MTELKFDKKIGIIIVDSRSKEHPDWVEKAIESCKTQIYRNLEIVKVSNVDKIYTPAKCYNDGVKALSKEIEWVLFVNDDDWITPDYVLSLYAFLNLNKEDKVVSITTHTTYFYENDEFEPIKRSPIGLWKKQYLIENPFDEKMYKFEDVAQFQKVKDLGYISYCLQWVYGYYYRQHKGQVSRPVENEIVTIKNNSKLERNMVSLSKKIMEIKTNENS